MNQPASETGRAESGRAESGAVTTTYTVSGMTCDHCVRAVTKEITTMVPDVRDVQIDLSTGRVTVRSDSVPDEATVRAAVAEAGYGVVS